MQKPKKRIKLPITKQTMGRGKQSRSSLGVGGGRGGVKNHPGDRTRHPTTIIVPTTIMGEITATTARFRGPLTMAVLTVVENHADNGIERRGTTITTTTTATITTATTTTITMDNNSRIKWSRLSHLDQLNFIRNNSLLRFWMSWMTRLRVGEEGMGMDLSMASSSRVVEIQKPVRTTSAGPTSTTVATINVRQLRTVNNIWDSISAITVAVVNEVASLLAVRPTLPL